MAGRPAEPFPAITATPLLFRGEADPAFVAVQVFLRRFGYLGEGTFDAGTLDDETGEALALYQRRNGLVVTATFDDQTRRRMVAHRCGMPDLVNRVAFVVRCSWTHPCLTFAFDSGTNDVAGNDEFEAVRAAVATWAAVTPLTFTEVGVSYHPDILIGWRPADDADFDLSGTIAHADYPPGCGVVSDVLPKPVHFNDSEINWVIGKVFWAYDVESVALHELGHVIGLEHSGVPDAVMNQDTSFSSTRRVLTVDDRDGINALYPAVIPNAGIVTIRQESTGRFLDAHEIEQNDFRLVTRPAQDNDSQRWTLTPVGTVNMIRQKSSGRFLDAHESAFGGFRAVTGDAKIGNSGESQRWIVVPAGGGSVTIRQLGTNRFLDAHEIADLDFAAVTRPAQHDDTQRWMLGPAGPNTVTLRQRSSGRLLDAHEISAKAFGVVTRPAQHDATQDWIFAPVGTVCTIQQRSNSRFVDAHEISSQDFAVVTRPAQHDETQRWILVASADGSFTIRQLSNGRLLDAYGSADDDFGVVTRPRSNHRAQSWFIDRV